MKQDFLTAEIPEPSVAYQVELTNGEMTASPSPQKLEEIFCPPPLSKYLSSLFEEPFRYEAPLETPDSIMCDLEK